MPKFKSPYKVADNLIKIYEELESPYTIDVDTFIKLSGREKTFGALTRKLFQKVSEILDEKGYLIFNVNMEGDDMLAIIKKENVLKEWKYLDEKDISDIKGIVEDEDDMIILEED